MARGEFNPGQGDVRAEIGGRAFILRYTLRALQVLQKQIGRERFGLLLTGSQEAFEDMEVLEAMLMAGLLYHHGDMSNAPDGFDVMSELNLTSLGLLAQTMSGGISASFPAAQEGGAAGPPTPTAASPGSTSTS